MSTRSKKMEDKLLGNSNVEKAFSDAMQEEINQAKAPKEVAVITDIKSLTEKQIYSSKALFKVFNRNTDVETFVNGVQADSIVSQNKTKRTLIAKGEKKNAITEDYFIEFIKYEG